MAKQKKNKGKTTLSDQCEMTGVQHGGNGMAGRSTVVLGVRQQKTVSGIKFDPKTHKRITHTFKEAKPLDDNYAKMSLEELQNATKELVAELKRKKKDGVAKEELAEEMKRLKEMKRMQDSKAAEVVKADFSALETVPA